MFNTSNEGFVLSVLADLVVHPDSVVVPREPFVAALAVEALRSAFSNHIAFPLVQHWNRQVGLVDQISSYFGRIQNANIIARRYINLIERTKSEFPCIFANWSIRRHFQDNGAATVT